MNYICQYVTIMLVCMLNCYLGCYRIYDVIAIFFNFRKLFFRFGIAQLVLCIVRLYDRIIRCKARARLIIVWSDQVYSGGKEMQFFFFFEKQTHTQGRGKGVQNLVFNEWHIMCDLIYVDFEFILFICEDFCLFSI